MSTSSPLLSYLCSSPITYMPNTHYDDKGRQLPFEETPTQKQERVAFMHSIRWQRRVSMWIKDQQASSSSASGHAASTTSPPASRTSSSSSSSPDTPSTTCSESSSPHTPSSPRHSPHPLPLDVELTKSFDKLALTVTPPLSSRSPPTFPHVQHNRNYKNLHLAQPLAPTHSRAQTRAQPRFQSQAPRGIFDSSSYTYPSLYSHPYAPPDEDHEADGVEPYIFYSSSMSSDLVRETKKAVASIGEFPTPKALAPTSSLSSPLRPLTFPSLSHSKPPSGASLGLNVGLVADY